MHSSFGKGGEWGYLYLGQWIALWKGGIVQALRQTLDIGRNLFSHSVCALILLLETESGLNGL